jgi:hypothetical protein
MSEALKPAGQLTDRFGGKKLFLITLAVYESPAASRA